MTGTVERTCTSTPAALHSESRVSTFQLLLSISRKREPLTISRARPLPGVWCSIRTNFSPPRTLRKSGSLSGRMWVWTSIFSKSGGRLGHHRAALPARAVLLVGEEPVENRREIFLDVMKGEELFVQQGIAFVAIPLKSVPFVRETLAFDNEPHGV